MIIINKQIGETPLSALKKFRQKNPEYEDARLSYAGRLDPMASGLLLILEDEEINQREKYLNLDKAYEFQVLFGVTTDTYDLLGVVDQIQKEPVSVDKQQVDKFLPELTGRQEMKYPPYSSKTVAVDGKKKSLWKLARSGRIDEVTLPTKEVEVYSLSCQEVQSVTKNYIINYIIKHVGSVEGDFRQEEIIEQWKQSLVGAPDEFKLGSFQMKCSSGTYVRRIAQRLGEQTECGAVTFSIKRTRVGGYELSDAD